MYVFVVKGIAYCKYPGRLEGDVHESVLADIKSDRFSEDGRK